MTYIATQVLKTLGALYSNNAHYYHLMSYREVNTQHLQYK